MSHFCQFFWFLPPIYRNTFSPQCPPKNLVSPLDVIEVLSPWLPAQSLCVFPGPWLSRGGYSSLVLVGMCRHGIWKYTHTNTNFSRKSDPFIYQSVQFLAKFWAKSPDFSKIFLHLSQFWPKFGELLKNQPIHIPTLKKIKVSFENCKGVAFGSPDKNAMVSFLTPLRFNNDTLMVSRWHL